MLRLLVHNRGLLILFSSQLLSRLGDSLETIAFLFLVMKKTGSTSALALFVICNALPNILFSPIAGVVADRYSRKTIMIVAESMRFLIIGVVAGLYFLDHLSVVTIFVAGCLVSVFESFFGTAKQASIPNLVPPEQLGQAISFMQISQSLAQMISLGIAGVVVATLGYGMAFAIDSTSFLISAVSILFIVIPQKFKVEANNYWQDFMAGLRYIRPFKILIYVMVAGFVANFFLSPINVLIPVLTKQILGSGEQVVGYLFAILSGGLLLGSILGQHVKVYDDYLGTRWVFVIFFFLLGCGFGVSNLGNSVLIYYLALFIIGLSVSLLGIHVNYVFQKTVADEYRGRASSILDISMTVSFPLSVGLAGLILEWMPVQQLMLISGVGIITFAIASIRLCGQNHLLRARKDTTNQ